MLKLKKSKSNNAFGLIEIMIVLIIISVISFLYLKRTVTQPVVNKEVQKVAQEQGIDTSNSKKLIDTTKQKLYEINVQRNKQMNQVNE